MQTYSLFELNEYLHRVVALNFTEALWIRAEIMQLKHSKGQMYLNLVEKGEDNDQLIAQSDAVIWAKTFRKLKTRIGETLYELLQEGMEVLLKVRLEFHERYGFKLIIADIDPAFTLGKLELKRRQMIDVLAKEQLIGKNTHIPLPLVIQKIAVLSSKQAAGFQDFERQLRENEFGYQFKIELFETAVQGIRVEKEILFQLKQIESRSSSFDCIAIIRGGGAKMDLSAFNNLSICRKAALSSFPILSGIGHDVDETALDLVVYKALKTPTAVADFIIHHNFQYELSIKQLANQLKMFGEQYIQQEFTHLKQLHEALQFQSQNHFKQQSLELDFINTQLPVYTKQFLHLQSTHLDFLKKSIDILHPDIQFQRGFSLALHNGKIIDDIDELKKGDEVLTTFKNGVIKSIIK